MKKIILIFIITFQFVGCLYEQPSACYYFRVVNRTNQNIFISYKARIQFAFPELKLDTLKPNEMLEEMIPKPRCYKDYKDSIFYKFFSEFSIETINGKITKEPFLRSNWSDSLILKNMLWGCKSSCEYGKAFYIFRVEQENILPDSLVMK